MIYFFVGEVFVCESKREREREKERERERERERECLIMIKKN